MFGKNEILKPENHDGSSLDVVKIFPTFQGEGPYVGYPAVFIRLSGCNLACNFCDTEFDSYHRMELVEIITEVLRLAKNDSGEIVRKLIVITGGEPLRQPISKLCQMLVELKFLVQIETNGTLFRELPQEIKIICSPKNVDGKYYKIRPDLLSRINAFKFIISAHDKKYSDIAEVGQSVKSIPVYLQAMDEYNVEKNKANAALVLQLAEKYGCRISVQIHKILQIE